MDLIERQAAIYEILGQPPEPHYPSWYAEQIKQLPPAQPEPCEDAVSRKAVIDMIGEWKEACADSGHKEAVSDIMLIRKDFIELPSVTPKQRTGKWINKYWHGENTRECSVCHVTQSVTVFEGKVMYKYCPYCGAKMEGREE